MIDGTLQTIDGRPALRFERHLAHSVQARLARRHGAQRARTVVRGAGAVDTDARRDLEGDGQAGAVTALEEPTLLRWEWGDERYAERFGVDPEIGRRAYAAHPQT